MSVQHLCDGCGKKLSDPVKSGSVLVRDYCKQCADIAEDFLKEEEALRVQLTSKYSVSRLKLIKKFSKDKFVLPDVIYDNT